MGEYIMDTQKGYRKANGSYHIFQEELSPAEWQHSLLQPALCCYVNSVVIFGVISMFSGIQYSILLGHL